MTASVRPQRGEIWYAFLPGQPDDPHQPRPCLVVSIDVRNRRSDDVIVVPIFSHGRLGPTHVAILTGMGGLSRDSVLFCEEIATLDQSFLARGPLGPLAPRRVLDDVVQGILFAVGGRRRLVPLLDATE